MKRSLKWVLVVLIAWWIVQDPTSAAHFVREISAGLSHAARSLASFASRI